MTEISSVKPENIKNPFAEFKQNSNGYYFMTQTPNTVPDSFESTTKEKQEEKKTKHLGKTIAFSALGTGLGILFLMKGLPKMPTKPLKNGHRNLKLNLTSSAKTVR